MSEGRLRNKPCPCGSNRKYKNCCLNKKQRHISTVFNIQVPPELQGEPPIFHWSMENGKPSMKMAGVPLALTDGTYKISRDRDNNLKPLKPIAEIPVSENALPFERGFFGDEYDVLYVVDTNSKLVNGVVCYCTAAILVLPNDKNNNIAATGAHTRFRYMYGFTEPVTDPENCGWYCLIEALEREFETGPRPKRIGIVVDSDYRNLPEYNKRSKPFFEDSFLPDDMQFLYASDEGNATPYNLLIRACHKASTEQLSRHSAGQPTLSLVDCTHNYLANLGRS